MRNILRNWKTTLLGLATIAIGLLSGKGKIDATTGSAIVAGLGLVLAKDGDKTGAEVKPNDNE